MLVIDVITVHFYCIFSDSTKVTLTSMSHGRKSDRWETIWEWGNWVRSFIIWM